MRDEEERDNLKCLRGVRYLTRLESSPPLRSTPIGASLMSRLWVALMSVSLKTSRSAVSVALLGWNHSGWNSPVCRCFFFKLILANLLGTGCVLFFLCYIMCRLLNLILPEDGWIHRCKNFEPTFIAFSTHSQPMNRYEKKLSLYCCCMTKANVSLTI